MVFKLYFFFSIVKCASANTAQTLRLSRAQKEEEEEEGEFFELDQSQHYLRSLHFYGLHN